MSVRPVVLPLAVLLALAGCADALDWREMKPAELRLGVSMPCRPASHARRVQVAGQAVDMTMLACTAQAWTFSVSGLDAADPARVGAVLAALQAAAVANIQGHVVADVPADVPGMTPHPSARRLSISGRRPDGRSVHEHLMLFSHGTRVYQAIMLGTEADEAVAGIFLASLKALP